MKKIKKTVISLIIAAVITLIILDASSDKKESPESKKILSAINLGGEWFLNNQNENFIYYEYNFSKREYLENNHPLREMGAMWSIATLSEFLEDDKYTLLANKGFTYFENYIEKDEEDDFSYVYVTDDIKLGYSAFMILSLLKLSHEKKEDHLEQIGNGILFLQQENGELRTFFYSDQNTGKDYYPGEALVALMAMYNYTSDKKYLYAVEKALPFYKEYFKNNQNTAFVPWQTRAYYSFYQETGNSKAAEFVFEMNDYMLNQNSPKSNCSNFEFPNGITTAVYLEGVNKAYLLAKRLNDEKRAICYLNFIKEASAYIIALQITESDDKKALGGFRGNEQSTTLRADRNQHAVMALMDSYEILK